MINLVEYIDSRLCSSDVRQCRVHDVDLLQDLRIARVDDVKQNIRFDGVLEGRGKRPDKFRREIPDESDSVVDEDFFSIGITP